MELEKSTEQTLIEAFTQQQRAFADAIMTETRKTRRSANWRTFAFVLVVVSIFATNMLYSTGIVGGTTIPKDGKYVSLVRLDGPIEAGQANSFQQIENHLYQAFHDKEAKGVLLVINSPGGTPVQSHKLYKYLLNLKEDTGKHLVVLGDDMLTSGAYMVAVAADKIFVNPSTLTGSIGVFQQSFGFKDLADKVGVHARTIVAGENKRRLDPFLDTDPEDLQKVQSVLNDIHQQFIAVVKDSRADKLTSDQNLFTGDYWTGHEAVELGLVDGIETYHGVLESEFGAQHALDYTQKPGLFSRLPRVAETWLEDATLNILNSATNSIPRL